MQASSIARQAGSDLIIASTEGDAMK